MASKENTREQKRYVSIKRCSMGACNSDTRYPERVIGVKFIPFVKPGPNNYHLDRCLRWIKACGRPHDQFNVHNIKRWTYVCSKHFVDGEPTVQNPDPVPAIGINPRRRKPYTPRFAPEQPLPCKKRKKEPVAEMDASVCLDNLQQDLESPLTRSAGASSTSASSTSASSTSTTRNLPKTADTMDRVKDKATEGERAPSVDRQVTVIVTANGGQAKVIIESVGPNKNDTHIVYQYVSTAESLSQPRKKTRSAGARSLPETANAMDRVKERDVEGKRTPPVDSEVVVKLEPAWSMEEDSPDQPSAVYSTSQPMSDSTSGSSTDLDTEFVLSSTRDLSKTADTMDGVKEEVVEGDCTPWMDTGVVVKQEPSSFMEENSPDQPSAVYSTVQPMTGNSSGSLLSLNTSYSCQHCSAAFALVSSLELHLASVHGEPLPFPEWTENSNNQKLEPAWSMEEDSPDQPSAVYSTAQPMSDNASWSLLSLKRGRVCQHCSAAFVLGSSLELHLASVHGEKLHMVLPGSSVPDRCYANNLKKSDIDKEVDSYSYRKITTKTTVDNHTAEKDGRNSSSQHVCGVCLHVFSSRNELKRHKLSHSGVKSFVCDVCSKSFARADVFKEHKRNHTGEMPFKCPHCDRDFKRSSHLQGHIKSVHDGEKMTTQTKADDNVTGQKEGKSRNRSSQHVCDVCMRVLSSCNELKRHKLSHSSVKPFVCGICGKGFTRADVLNQHKKNHTGERSFKCPHCESDFKRSSHLHSHIKSVHDMGRPHVCDVCGKAFSRNSVLTRHRKTHTGDKPHVCSHCGKGYTCFSHLQSHRLTHNADKPFVCEDCGKGFIRPSDLRRHSLTHTGQKPHVCPDCGKGFADPRTLQKHCLTHSEKPFVCEDCGKGFPTPADLEDHRLTHTGEKPHVCSNCGKGFARSSQLQSHLLTHSEKRDHSCPHCPSAFKWSHNLKKHVLNIHQ